MSVLLIPASVTRTLNVRMPMVHTVVPVKQDSQEMELLAKVRSLFCRYTVHSSVPPLFFYLIRSFYVFLFTSSAIMKM